GGVNTSAAQTFTIAVTAVNDAPVAGNDSFTTAEDTPLTISAPGVLTNRSEERRDGLTALLVTGPTNGALTFSATGGFTYTPTANFNGTDTFTYRASDGTADSNLATVTITVMAVNDAPVAGNDTFTTAEDTPLLISAPGVLTN